MSNKAWDLISYNQQEDFNKHSVVWATEDDKQFHELYEDWKATPLSTLHIKPCDPNCTCDCENGCCDATA